MRFYLSITSFAIVVCATVTANSVLAITYTNVTTNTVLLSDDFEGVSAIGVGFDNDPGTTDFDPVAGVGTWDIEEGVVDNGDDDTFIQVTDFNGNTTTNVNYPGAIQGNNYMWVNREGFFNKAVGLTSGVQDTLGDEIHVEWMAFIRSGWTGNGPGVFNMYEGATASGDRVAGIAAVGNGTLTDASGLTWTADTWQRWEFDYVVGDSTYDLKIDGIQATDVPIHSSTLKTAGAIRFSSSAKTEYFVDGAPELNLPELIIDRTTGEIRLQNNNGSAVTGLIGYSITSELGALDQTSWIPIAGTYDALPGNGGTTGDGTLDADDNWTVLTGTGVATDLSEAEFDGGTGAQFPAGTDKGFGDAWVQNLVEDVQFQVLLDDGELYFADVTFVGGPAGGYDRSDLNFDTEINVDDWAIFIAHLETDLSGDAPAQAYQKGDLDYDGFNNDVDLELFITDYNVANGAGSFAAMLASVPEPTSMILVLIGGLTLVWKSSRITRSES